MTGGGGRRPRSRAACAILLAAIVVAGLSSRTFPAYQPSFVAQYAGDVLWATMAFWGLALLRPAASTHRLGIATLALAWTVELSQLIHVGWLDSLRDTRPGMLALGQGFLWSDLVCYSVGTALAMAIDSAIRLSPGRA